MLLIPKQMIELNVVDVTHAPISYNSPTVGCLDPDTLLWDQQVVLILYFCSSPKLDGWVTTL